MKRIKDGFRLLKQSWSVVRQDPELIFVMAGGVMLQLLVLAGLFLLVFRRAPEAADFTFPRMLWLLPLYGVAGVVGSLTGGTVVATACQRLEGRDASVREGFSRAWSRSPALIGWSFLAAGVGMLLSVIAERLKLEGRVAALIGGVTWAVVTMLVIPVILFEDKGAFGSIKRSGSLVKERWGEGVTGYGTINVALMILFIPVMVAAPFLMLVDVVLGLTVMVIAFLSLIAVSGALGGVFNVALYRYAAAGEATGPFQESQLATTFVTKEEKKKPARRIWRILGFVFIGVYALLKLLEVTGVIPSAG